MELSVIIVSYNVRYFLDQAIASVLQSTCNFDYEIIVVDNGSTDDSVEWVKSNYPDVRLFDLGENLGFAKANNYAAKRANGDCILLLNPDTIVQSDSLQVCYDFLVSQKNIGAVGLRMFDGQGKYLPESKRGFPGPWTSFCKITGLNHLFPTSRLFNYYYLGHKSSDKIQEVDVLTGAFMMMRKAHYLKLKGLDEDFFMYGEDIDLCYRLHESGYQNHYLASSSIIHFKGESTSKQSLKYIKTFYSAMSIYAGKHYNRHILAIMSVFIQGAIYARAGLAIIYQNVKNFRDWIQYFLFLLLGLPNLCDILGLHIDFDYHFLLPPFIFATIDRLLSQYKSKWHWWPHFLALFLGILIILPIAFITNQLIWSFSAGLALLYFLGNLLFQPGPIFLPDLQTDRFALVFSDANSFSKIKSILDKLPGSERIEDALRKDDLPIPADDMPASNEFIFTPSFLQWSDIVKCIIKFGSEKANRILSADFSCLLSSRSKNEAALLITEKFLHEKRYEDVLKKKKRHEFIYSLFVLLCVPILFLIINKEAISKARSALLSGKSWFHGSDDSRFRMSPSTKEERAEYIQDRQYFFIEYQKKLWSHTF
ncbi:MAG: glycosyltransferase [Bacteroidetes bacterium]|jgi:GT2 family glycosyltransferase|nr:glycosyltransferase [Bacteroidota bacterium]